MNFTHFKVKAISSAVASAIAFTLTLTAFAQGSPRLRTPRRAVPGPDPVAIQQRRCRKAPRLGISITRKALAPGRLVLAPAVMYFQRLLPLARQ